MLGRFIGFLIQLTNICFKADFKHPLTDSTLRLTFMQINSYTPLGWKAWQTTSYSGGKLYYLPYKQLTLPGLLFILTIFISKALKLLLCMGLVANYSPICFGPQICIFMLTNYIFYTLLYNYPVFYQPSQLTLTRHTLRFGNPLVTSSLNFTAWVNLQINTLSRFFSQNELVLQDGFLIDFLQKQTLELWLRQYVLSTGSIFSERLVFETITKFFFKYILWPTKTRVYFEAVSVSDLLLITFYTILTIADRKSVV